MGGHEVTVSFDAVMAAFAKPKDAALAAIEAQRTVADHEWPHGPRLTISVGIHSGQAGVGWIGPAVRRCEHLCSSAEGGEILLSRAASALLEDEDLAGAVVRDLGERPIRGSSATVHAYELVVPA